MVTMQAAATKTISINEKGSSPQIEQMYLIRKSKFIKQADN